MRPLFFIPFLLLCNLYGLAFDMVVVSRTSGIVCDLLGTEPCRLPQPADYWISVVILMLLLPATCGLLAHWFSSGLRLLKSMAFMGLLLITP